MKVKHAFRVGNKVIPAGSELHFGQEGFGFYDGIKVFKKNIPAVALESDDCETEDDEMKPEEIGEEGNGSAIAEAVLTMLNEAFPEGFSKTDLDEAYGDKLDGNDYSIHQMDESIVMILKSEDDEAIEIYLTEADGKYKPTGEYHVASDVEMVATEAFISRIKNTRAAKINAKRRSK